MKERYIKSINFDLDTNKLKEVYPGKHYTKAYADVKSFFKKNEFIHRQGSGYFSDKELTYASSIKTVKKLIKTYPWLKGCVKKFDITNIGKDYDLTNLFEKGDSVNELDIFIQGKSQDSDKTRPLSQWKADIETMKVEREASDADIDSKALTEKER